MKKKFIRPASMPRAIKTKKNITDDSGSEDDMHCKPCPPCPSTSTPMKMNRTSINHKIYTISTFFNFMREHRRTHKISSIATALVWNKMSPADKAKYKRESYERNFLGKENKEMHSSATKKTTSKMDKNHGC